MPEASDNKLYLQVIWKIGHATAYASRQTSAPGIRFHMSHPMHMHLHVPIRMRTNVKMQFECRLDSHVSHSYLSQTINLHLYANSTTRQSAR